MLAWYCLQGHVYCNEGWHAISPESNDRTPILNGPEKFAAISLTAATTTLGFAPPSSFRRSKAHLFCGATSLRKPLE